MLKSVHLTTQEAHILDVAARIKYGEIRNAEVDCRQPAVARDLTDAQMRFIALIREEGWVCLHKVTVHDGVPWIVEIDGEDGGLEYFIKRKV